MCIYIYNTYIDSWFLPGDHDCTIPPLLRVSWASPLPWSSPTWVRPMAPPRAAWASPPWEFLLRRRPWRGGSDPG